MNLADKIISLRKQKGWSQEELAAQMDVSRQAVSKWESEASSPDIDKIILLSKIFDVSTDFLLKDNDEQANIETESSNENAEDIKEPIKRFVSKNEARDYIDLRKEIAKKIALGVWLCILSPITMFILLGMSQDKSSNVISEEMASIVGVCAILIIVAGAVALFVTSGFKLSQYEYMEKEAFIIDRETKEETKLMDEQYAPIFRTNMTIGIIVCIISAIPLLLSAATEDEKLVLWALALLLLIVSFGVYRIVKVAIVKSGFQQILQEGEYKEEIKEANKDMEPFTAVYWMVIVAAYLLVSFLTNKWEITWVIWPVAGICFGAMSVIFRSIKEKRN